ncbi:MAG: RnfABCDGE type electron transport complex subunit C [Candidatus Omnitrophica bacterium]|nr:RnfABCDGE type electron transport complex subunit C [Candidatus Omnitrophota bacterium]
MKMRGLRLDAKKESFQSFWTLTRPGPPSRICVFLKNPFSGSRARALVQAGDYVLTGQKIAQAEDPRSVNLFSGISGRVSQISFFRHPAGTEERAIEIESDRRDKRNPEIGTERLGWQNLSREKYLELFREMGLVDLSPAEKPLHGLFENGSSENETLLLNGCESEPYTAADYALMMSHPLEILKGAEIMRQAAGAKRFVLFLTDEKSEAVEILRSKLFFLKWNHCEVRTLKNLYPAGDPSLLKRIEKGTVLNIATAYAVYEAVLLQKPFYERAVTVGAECVAEPKNYWLRIGTLMEEAFKLSRGFLRPPAKVLMGGPMRGLVQASLSVPLAAGISALLGLAPEVAAGPEEIQPCIHCGRCLEVCPENLSPAMISLASEAHQMDWAREWGAQDCTACGNCSYICPSKRPLVEMIVKAIQN